MSPAFHLTQLAIEDIDAIWWFIAEDSKDAADRVEREIVATCRRPAMHPLIGTTRHDITPLPVRFWAIPNFSNYVVVYRPDTVPIQVVAVCGLVWQPRSGAGFGRAVALKTQGDKIVQNWCRWISRETDWMATELKFEAHGYGWLRRTYRWDDGRSRKRWWQRVGVPDQ